MRLTDEMKKEDFMAIRDRLLDIEIASRILEKGEIVEEMGLLLLYPDESGEKEPEEMTEEDLLSAISYLFEIEDSDDQINKYMMIFTELKKAYNDIDDLKLYQVLNEYNRELPIGYFFPDQNEDGDLRIKFKATLHSPMGEVFDVDAYCETIIQMIFYVSDLTNVLDEL